LQDLSDAATVEALAFNMAWHHALDVRVEADCYFREKTLRNYRRLFLAEGLDEVLFRRMTDRLVRVFSVATSRQRMDSTALRSAMRSLTRPFFSRMRGSSLRPFRNSCASLRGFIPRCMR
jgi:hypothetical protein